MKAPLIVCSHCAGAGFVDMPDAYARTYALVPSVWAETTTILASHPEEIAHTALLNRLNWLVDQGRIRRRRRDNSVEWRRQ